MSQALFDLMSREHGLSLLDSEMDEIERVILNNHKDAIQSALTERDALRAFAQEVMQCWPEGGIDGGDIEDAAIRHGLLKEEVRTERCGKRCACAIYGRFPKICFQRTAMLDGKELA